MMDQFIDVVKVLCLNVGTFAVVTLSDLKLMLKCTLLLATIIYTTLKALSTWRALNDKNDKE